MATVIAKEPIVSIKNENKRAIFDQQKANLKLYCENRHQIRHQFNLKAMPQPNRVLNYLRTKDSKVFDGLLRND